MNIWCFKDPYLIKNNCTDILNIDLRLRKSIRMHVINLFMLILIILWEKKKQNLMKGKYLRDFTQEKKI